MNGAYYPDLAGRGSAQGLLVLLKVGVVVGCFTTAIAVTIARLPEGTPEAPQNELTIGLLAIVFIAAMFLFYIAFISSIVIFSLWIHQSCQNLRLLGSLKQTFNPSMSVWVFYLPIYQLIRPFTVLNELWRGSSPEAALDNALAWRRLSTPAFIYFWWGCWLFYFVGGTVLLNVSSGLPEDTPGGLLVLLSTVAAVLLTLPCFLLCHRYVASVARNQHKRYGKVLAYCRDNGKLHYHYIEELAAQAAVLQPAQDAALKAERAAAERKVSFKGALAAEKIGAMAAIPVLLIALYVHQTTNLDAFQILPSEMPGYGFLYLVIGGVYLFACWRALFKGMKSESWGCLIVTGLLLVLAVILFFVVNAAQNPYLLLWYALVAAYHLWLLTIVIRDLSRFDAQSA